MGELKIGRMVLGMVRTNCYFLYREDSKEVLCVDPADCGQHIFDRLSEQFFTISAILLTHGHFDHITGVNELRGLSGAKVYALDLEKVVCEDGEVNMSHEVGRPVTVVPDVYLRDQDKVTMAGLAFRIISTPGHTVGSCCYYFEEDKVLISGDTLFAGSVGRTDLPTGSEGTLMRSIKERLFVLPSDVRVYPGHDDSTTVGWEREHNPDVV